MKITSVNNDLVKETSKLLNRKYRDERKLFLLEGRKCIDEAISSGIQINTIFIKDGSQIFEGFENIETTEAVLKKISSTDSPPSCVAVAKKKEYEWKKTFKKVLLLENIKDAGNLGTILRSACAFNADAVILYGDTVDLYNPKCVRSSVGNLWKIPVFEIKKLDELQEIVLKDSNFEITGTLPKSENSVWLNDYKPAEQILIMFGTESTGLSDDLKKLTTKNITIEMSSKVESLNLSTSVSIILYKLSIS